ncbi:DUF924 family protein [Nitrobacter sp. NHB1]|uniref:DUF924 family protein n=1 Tax=Nitrobacter sp. NHB1 TaxID=3119830 RepID=UPI002FFE2E18
MNSDNPPASIPTPGDVLAFWRAAGQSKWYIKDDTFDAEVRRRFLGLWEAARAGELAGWEETDDGALALIIVLDQFPRNMFRGDARSFSTDDNACAVADRAIARGADMRIEPDLIEFLYVPFMHSERLADQERCVALFRSRGRPDNLKFAEVHADIIRRFDRFPHRNRMLNRTTSAEEQAFLDGGGFAG